jgi:hypothetical protein
VPIAVFATRPAYAKVVANARLTAMAMAKLFKGKFSIVVDAAGKVIENF